MGLDMYLSKKTNVKNWEHFAPEDVTKVTVKRMGKKVKHINPKRISYIVEEIAYWRKSNQIHNWFIKNVANGVDDCVEFEVSEEKLRELLKNCEEVLSKSKLVDGKVCNGKSLKNGVWVDILEDGKNIEDTSVAEALLPTTSGFFFGGTNYDEYYYQDLEQTVEMLKPVLDGKLPDGVYPEYSYQASW